MNVTIPIHRRPPNSTLYIMCCSFVLIIKRRIFICLLYVLIISRPSFISSASLFASMMLMQRVCEEEEVTMAALFTLHISLAIYSCIHSHFPPRRPTERHATIWRRQQTNNPHKKTLLRSPFILCKTQSSIGKALKSINTHTRTHIATHNAIDCVVVCVKCVVLYIALVWSHDDAVYVYKIWKTRIFIMYEHSIYFRPRTVLMQHHLMHRRTPIRTSGEEHRNCAVIYNNYTITIHQ